MSIYGNMLLSFPEQFVTVPYFNMLPNINDGYGNRTDNVSINCIIQNKGSGVKDSNGHIVRNSAYFLWSMTELIAGRFIEWQGIVYRLIIDNDWPREGGYYQYDMEKLVGNDGTIASNDYFEDIGGTPL